MVNNVIFVKRNDIVSFYALQCVLYKWSISVHMKLQYIVPINPHFINVGCYQQWIILLESRTNTSSIKYTTHYVTMIQFVS